jgi:hypothetical protein
MFSRADLARLARVSRAAVTKLCKDGAPLAAAVVGKKIDAEHPLVREWLAGKGITEVKRYAPGDAPATKRPPRAKKVAPEAEPDRRFAPVSTQAGDDIPNFEDLTVREVVIQHGSVDGFKRYVEVLVKIADFKHREMKIRQQRDELVDRDQVRNLVFPLVDVAYSRLVTDVPTALSSAIVARVEAGGDDVVREVDGMIQAANSKVLKSTKSELLRSAVLGA